jgi:methyl-accepting chemotaxis protein
MSELSNKIPVWGEADRATGEIVHARAGKHVDHALLMAYRAVDPSLTAVPADILAVERRKFACISRGNFSPEYFADQEIITRNLAGQVDFITYLRGAYAYYAAGLVSGLVKEKRWTEKNSDELTVSLMRSVMTDAAVVMHFYFEAINAKADAERAAADAERARNEAERARLAAQQAKAVKALGDGLGRLADGDLTATIDVPFEGELDQIRHAYNNAVAKFADILGQLRATSMALKSATGEILSGSNDLAERTTKQAAAIEETSAAIEQLATTVNANAKRAEDASRMSRTVSNTAEQTGQVMEQSNAAMERISSSSQKISNIIGMIDDIAFQTNLLALNASVEAARAGDAGKGFAVVAVEVRRLAQSAAQASSEVKVLIEQSATEVAAGGRLVADATHKLVEMVKGVKDSAELVEDISVASREQASAIAEVSTAIRQMDEMTQHNAALVEETNAAIEQTENQANELDGIVEQFKVGTARAGGGREMATSAPVRRRRAA